MSLNVTMARNLGSKCGSIDEPTYYRRHINLTDTGDDYDNEDEEDEAANNDECLSVAENTHLTPLHHLSVNEVNMNTYTYPNAHSKSNNEYLEPNIDAGGYNLSIEDMTNVLRRKKSSLKKSIYKIQNVRKYTDCIFVRLFYIAVPVFRLYLSSCIYDEGLFIIVYTCSAAIIVDLVYALWKRDALDYYWFSISTTAFTIMMTTIILSLNEFKIKNDDFDCSTNRTMLDFYADCRNIHYMNFTSCSLSEIYTITFLMALTFTRWIMPVSKKINPEAIYQQIFSYTSTAADIVDIADYMQSPRFSNHRGLIRCTELVFSLSLIQFSFSLTATKKRNHKLTGGVYKLVDIIFATEAWSLLLALFSQVIPCYIIRIMILMTVNVKIQLSLHFFTFKNAVMIFLLIYRIVVVVYRKYKEEAELLASSNSTSNGGINSNFSSNDMKSKRVGN